MTWHDEGRPKDGNIRRPADGESWKEFDSLYPHFAKETRNVRLGLSSDGFNPFRTASVSHSTWPVVLINYNLPPWMSLKPEYFMLSLLIPGPESPGNNIDVYLQPLIDELKELWDDGLETYDKSKDETFKMYAALTWTISDFPSYSMLSGWKTKGKFACPCCNYETSSLYLKHSMKTCYMDHRRFLNAQHPWRRNKSAFNGKIEKRLSPTPLSGDEALSELSSFENIFGKTQKKKNDSTCPWKKSGKSKDHPKARFDLLELGIKERLQPKLSNDSKHVIMESACFSMSSKEKVNEVRLGGPVQYRWMFPVERYLCKLKSYVRNKGQPEGSIAEGYLIEECLTICSRYMDGENPRLNKGAEDVDELDEEKELGGPKLMIISLSMKLILTINPEKLNEHVHKTIVMSSPVGSKIKRYKGYYANGYRFSTKSRDDKCQTQNSGVSITALTPNFASSRDKSPTVENVDYYGRILDIIELDYWSQFRVVLFHCEWYQVEKDDYGLTCVNMKKLCYSDDPFVMPSQVKQVFYIPDPIVNGLHYVVDTVPREVYDFDEESNETDDGSYWCEPNEDRLGYYTQASVQETRLSREDIPPLMVDVSTKLDATDVIDSENADDSDHYDDTLWDWMHPDEDDDN
ncbi:uncharacterized protein LOC118482611 [Helianthus annuus]|uniref:uncharacterized protein LOC118482611 n=1 Tax=Helianthus annuus TaxID=4232 RepID=UPI001652ED83|nr:uncharacterized protein LOC118482611 [Helianthus annuus]